MGGVLSNAMVCVAAVRMANEDVFKWPTVEWSALYTIEEITELMRYVQRQNAPDHLRGNQESMDKDRATSEWGQALMMLLTLGHQLGIDPDRALAIALEKIRIRSEGYRAAKRLCT